MEGKLNLKVDPDNITVEDLLAIEEGSLKTRAARDLIAKFITGEDGEYLPEAEARVVVNKLTLKQLVAVGVELGKEVEKMMGDLLPTKTVSG